MNSIYFDVSNQFDENGAERYTNHTRGRYVPFMESCQEDLDELLEERLLTDSQMEDVAREMEEFEKEYVEFKSTIASMNDYEETQENFGVVEDIIDEVITIAQEYGLEETDAVTEDDFDSNEELLESVQEKLDELKEQINSASANFAKVAHFINELNPEFDIESLADGSTTLGEEAEAYIDRSYDFGVPIYNYIYPISGSVDDDNIVKGLNDTAKEFSFLKFKDEDFDAFANVRSEGFSCESYKEFFEDLEVQAHFREYFEKGEQLREIGYYEAQLGTVIDAFNPEDYYSTVKFKFNVGDTDTFTMNLNSGSIEALTDFLEKIAPDAKA